MARTTTNRRNGTRARTGQVDIPIVMVFAVVTGVFLLLGVGYAVLRMQSNAAEAQRLESLADIRTTIASLEGSPGVTQNITLLAAEGGLRATCDENADWVIQYETDDFATLTGLLAVFPERANGEVRTVRTALVGSSYRIGTIVYVHTPNLRITRGDNLPAFPVPTEQASDKTLSRTLDGQTISFTVTPSPSEPNAGMVTLPDSAGNPVSLPYFEPALLAAAATAGSSEGYSCVLNRYVQLLAFATEAQYRRMQSLRSTYQLENNPCSAIYDDAPFEDINSVLYSVDPPTKPSDIRTADDLNTLEQAETIAGGLRRVNEMNARLIRGDRCATIS